MKTLTILRHLKSSWKDSNLPDIERPLSRRGKEDAPIMATRIREAGIRPSLIISSPATRAWTTAKFIAKEISYPIEFLQREQEMYLADVEQLLELLERQDNKFNSIMIVGHNPGLTEFANYLLPQLTDNIPTGGVVSLNIETDDWNLRQRTPAELLVFDYPKSEQP